MYIFLALLIIGSNAQYWCWSVGDPHFKTFDNRRFDHMRHGRNMLLQWGEYKLYTWHHRRRGPAANSAFQITRYNENVAKMACIEPRLSHCVWRVARGKEKYIQVGRVNSHCGRQYGMNTRIPPHCPNWVIRTPKSPHFALFLKTRNRCGRGHWCERGWTDLAVRWSGNLHGVQRGMCVRPPKHPCSARDWSSRCGPGAEKVPTCSLVRSCCRHYRKKPRLEKTCNEDAGIRCCEGRGRGNPNCCKIYEKHCGIDYECGNNQVCDEKMNLCKKRPIKKCPLKNARPYKDDYTEWTNTKTTNCGGWGKILGGYNVLGKGKTLEKFFKLPCSSNRVRLEFQFLRIDSWDGEEAWLKINGKEVWRKQGRHNEAGSRNICGRGWGDSLWDVDLGQMIIRKDVMHLRMGTTLNQAANDESWGLRNIRVTAKCAHKRQVKNTKGKRYGKYKNPGRCTGSAGQGELGDMGKWIDMKKNDIEQNLRECIYAACMPYDSCNFISCCGQNNNMCIAYNKCPNDPKRLHNKKHWVTTQSYHVEHPTGVSLEENEEGFERPTKADHKKYVEEMIAALDAEEKEDEFEPDEEWKDIPILDLDDLLESPLEEAMPENDQTDWVDAEEVELSEENFGDDFHTVMDLINIPFSHQHEFSGFDDYAADPKEEAMLSASFSEAMRKENHDIDQSVVAEIEKAKEEDEAKEEDVQQPQPEENSNDVQKENEEAAKSFLNSLPLAKTQKKELEIATSQADFDYGQVAMLILGGLLFAISMLSLYRSWVKKRDYQELNITLIDEN